MIHIHTFFRLFSGMTGALHSLGGSQCGTPIVAGLWSSKYSCRRKTQRYGIQFDMNCSSFSIPYYPPPREYLSLEGAVEKFPRYGYQLYFADPASSSEIDQNVRFKRQK